MTPETMARRRKRRRGPIRQEIVCAGGRTGRGRRLLRSPSRRLPNIEQEASAFKSKGRSRRCQRRQGVLTPSPRMGLNLPLSFYVALDLKIFYNDMFFLFSAVLFYTYSRNFWTIVDEARLFVRFVLYPVTVVCTVILYFNYVRPSSNSEVQIETPREG